MNIAKLTFRIEATRANENEPKMILFDERSVTAYVTDEDLDPTDRIRSKLPNATDEQLTTIVNAERRMRINDAAKTAMSGLEDPALAVIRDRLDTHGAAKLVFQFDDGPPSQLVSFLGPKEERKLSESTVPGARAKWIDEIVRASMLNVHRWFCMQIRDKFGITA